MSTSTPIRPRPPEPGGDLGRLRLLVAFDALLREGSVSRAAEALDLQPSAVSRMLGQLRALYDNPLFIRTGKGLVPTPLSERLRLRVRALVEESERLLQRPDEDAAAVEERPTGWDQPGLIAAPPLAVRPAILLDGQPSPEMIARRLAGIGSNADPQQRLGKYIATIGGGTGRSRPLSEAEAQDALSVILEGEADPIQIGAFLSVMQYRGSSPAELAGFVTATRRHCRALQAPESGADLDWPCYLSPRLRSAPWFLHAARLVAMAGHRVLLHGHSGGGAEAGKLQRACQSAGIAVCHSIAEARDTVARQGIAYLPLTDAAAQVQQMLALHRLTEMRGPMHTVVHLINPLNARVSLLGAPNALNLDLHRDVAMLLGISTMAVLGNRDVAQFTPFRASTIFRLVDGVPSDLPVPRQATPARQAPTGLTSREYWEAVWTGAARDRSAETIVLTTAAAAFLTLSRDPASTFDDACALAKAYWDRRLD